MKRVVCLILILLIVFGCCCFVFADNSKPTSLLGLNYVFNYVLNDISTLPDTLTFYVDFIRTSSSYHGFNFVIRSSSNYWLQFINSSGGFDTNYYHATASEGGNGWNGQPVSYRTIIEFTGGSDIDNPILIDWLYDNGTFTNFVPPTQPTVFDLVLQDISAVFDFGLDTLHTAISSITTTPILLIPCIMVFAYIGVRLFRVLLY